MMKKIFQFKNLFKPNKLTSEEIDEILKFNEKFNKSSTLTSKDLEKFIGVTLKEDKIQKGITKNKLIYLPQDATKKIIFDLNKKTKIKNIFNQYIENNSKNFESEIRIVSFKKEYSIKINPIYKGYRMNLFENENKEIQINNFERYKIKIFEEKNYGENKHPNYIELYALMKNKTVRWAYIQFEDKQAQDNFKSYLKLI